MRQRPTPSGFTYTSGISTTNSLGNNNKQPHRERKDSEERKYGLANSSRDLKGEAAADGCEMDIEASSSPGQSSEPSQHRLQPRPHSNRLVPFVRNPEEFEKLQSTFITVLSNSVEMFTIVQADARDRASGEEYYMRRYEYVSNSGFSPLLLKEIAILRSLSRPTEQLSHVILHSVPGDETGSAHPELLWRKQDRTPPYLSKDYININIKWKKAWMFQMVSLLTWFSKKGTLYRNLVVPHLLVEGKYIPGLDRYLEGLPVDSPHLFAYLSALVMRIGNRTDRSNTWPNTSPEVLLGLKEPTSESNIWSLGCLLTDLFVKKSLFCSDGVSSQFSQLLEIFQLTGKPIDTDVETGRGVNGEPHPTDWPGVSRLPFYNRDLPNWAGGRLEDSLVSSNVPPQVIDLVLKMLVLDPKKRIRIEDCLMHPFFDDVRASLQDTPHAMPSHIGDAAADTSLPVALANIDMREIEESGRRKSKRQEEDATELPSVVRKRMAREACSSPSFPPVGAEAQSTESFSIANPFEMGVVGLLRHLSDNQPKTIALDLSKRKGINAQMRFILIEWLLEVASLLHVTPDTMFVTTHLVDMMICQDDFKISRLNFQLLGEACFLVAVKLNDIYTVSLDELVFLSDCTYSPTQVEEMELNVLQHTQFNFSMVTPLHYIRLFCGELGLRKHYSDLAISFASVQMLHYEYSTVHPHSAALACVALALSSWRTRLAMAREYSKRSMLDREQVSRMVLFDTIPRVEANLFPLLMEANIITDPVEARENVSVLLCLLIESLHPLGNSAYMKRKTTIEATFEQYGNSFHAVRSSTPTVKPNLADVHAACANFAAQGTVDSSLPSGFWPPFVVEPEDVQPVASSSRSLAHLPKDVLVYTFEYLHFSDWCRLACVCKSFQVCVSSPTLWANLGRSGEQRGLLDMSSAREVLDDNAIFHLAPKLKRVRKLSLFHCSLSIPVLNHLFQNCDNLLEIDLGYMSAPAGSWPSSSPTNSRRTVLPSLAQGRAGPSSSPMSSTVSIGSSNERIGNSSSGANINFHSHGHGGSSNEGSTAMQRLAALEYSDDLPESEEKMDARHVVLTPNAKLQVLNLSNCELINGKDVLNVLDICTDLRSLNIGGIPNNVVTSTLISKLKASSCAPNLEELHLNNCSAIMDVSLAWIAEACPNLLTLRLDMCDNVSDHGVSLIARSCKKLRRLGLSANPISDETLHAIATNCPDMEELALSFCYMLTSEGVQELARNCKKLQHVNLCLVDRLDDEGLCALADNCDLITLNLRGCSNISDDGISHLSSRCPNLRMLHLLDCSHVTLASVRAVRENCSNSVVIFD